MALEQVIAAASSVLAACRAQALRLVTAESCTGGLVAAALTEIAGSSDVVEGGFVTYSNAMKEAMLGVPHELLEAHGAVSEPVARAMAEAALMRAVRADLSVAVTGVAGPGGGSAEKPVGLVFIAAGRRGGPLLSERRVFAGDRRAIREAAVLRALELLLQQAAGT
ncbi:MAG TPA: nicotinamide-nucleotide amidohydrolase family protein [Alphaproteobacteria bacterium]|nr:nicotinamide-nucleotide amidohydrolase family protein [Alphaproteobacteria bacterium]